jgi:hypothetical protein
MSASFIKTKLCTATFETDGNWLASPDALRRDIFQYLVQRMSDNNCPLLIPSGRAMFFLGSRPRDIEQKASIPLGSTLVNNRLQYLHSYYDICC